MAKRQSVTSESTPEPTSAYEMADSPAALFARPAPAATSTEKPPEANPDEEPGKTDEPSTKEPDGTTEPEVEPESPEEGKEKPPDAKVETVAPKKFKLWTGREITAAELATNPELVEDIIQTANQFPNLQRKHVEMLEALAKQTTAKPDGKPAERPPTEPEPKAMSIDEAREAFVKEMTPKVGILVERGLLTQDTVDVNPDLATLAAYLIQQDQRRQAFEAEVNKAWVNLFVPMFKAAEEAYGSQQQREKDVKLETRLTALASSHSALKPLGDTEVRSSYIRHLRETVKAEDEAMDDRFLMGQFLAFQADPMLQALATVAEARDKQVARDTKRATGDGGGPAKTKVPGKNADIKDLFSGG